MERMDDPIKETVKKEINGRGKYGNRKRVQSKVNKK